MSRLDRPAASIARGLTRVTGSVLGPYQSAVIRIGFSATWLLFLLRELPHRHELYGPDGPWSWDMARQLIDDNHAFTVLMWFDGRGWFEFVYVLSIVSSALLMLGWRTRTMSVLFMVGVLSLQNRSVFMGDGGDNVIHLMGIYLVLTRCGQVWSLDARRRARARGDRFGPVLWGVLGAALIVFQLAGKVEWEWDASSPFDLSFVPLMLWGVWLGCGVQWLVQQYARDDEPRVLVDVLGNILHNAALFVIMAEACLIYATAGWYKIQGSRWQDGTAVYYPLNLDYFSPWPALSELLASSGVMLMLVTYGTVAVQVAFPFTLINRRVKNVLLAAMITEHAVIAVLLGLPFFSLAMIAADAVFLPTSFLRRVGGWASRARGRVLTGAAKGLPRQRTREEHEPEAAEHARVGFTS
ncbi:HTTM domain-containing protein [Streptomyces sp. T-3]|nr:HTTM domain-containing protein [Streptomyces sp. T-3]